MNKSVFTPRNPANSLQLRMRINLKIDMALLNAETYQHYACTTDLNIDPISVFPRYIHMYPWNDVQQCLQKISSLTNIPAKHQRLFLSGKEISASKHKQRTLYKCGLRDGSTLYLQCTRASAHCPLVTYGPCPALANNLHECEELMFKSSGGLLSSIAPELAPDGEGGTYFLHDQDYNRVSCFKPSDEEAGCVNNPRGRVAVSMREGIVPRSTGHIREAAAFLLDDRHFHDVPPTLRVELMTRDGQRKVGSLQAFVRGEVVENYGIQNFSVRDIHKIALLDVRILNCDRNCANILVSKDPASHRYQLVPIDHGLAFPEKIVIVSDEWCWLRWPQAKQPFDPFTKKFIEGIDIEADIERLRAEFGLSELCLENIRIANIVLQSGCRKGLTLHDIGSIIARPDFETPSLLESLMVQAEILAQEKYKQHEQQLRRRQAAAKYLLKRSRLRKSKKIQDKVLSLARLSSAPIPLRGFMSLSPGMGPTATHVRLPAGNQRSPRFKFVKKEPNCKVQRVESLVPQPFLTPTLPCHKFRFPRPRLIIVTPSKTPNPPAMGLLPMPELALTRSSIDVDPQPGSILNSLSGKPVTEDECSERLSQDNSNSLSIFTSMDNDNCSTNTDEQKMQLVDETSSSEHDLDDLDVNDDINRPSKNALTRSTSMFTLTSQRANEELIVRNKCSLPAISSYMLPNDEQIDRNLRNESEILGWSFEALSLKSNGRKKRRPRDGQFAAREFGIHPIMQRVVSDDNMLRRLFLHYLTAMMDTQCTKIIMRSKKSKVEKKLDTIYDVDTVSGAFVWKNELRKYWEKNVFQLRREERRKQNERLIGPFEFEMDMGDADADSESQQEVGITFIQADSIVDTD